MSPHSAHRRSGTWRTPGRASSWPRSTAEWTSTTPTSRLGGEVGPTTRSTHGRRPTTPTDLTGHGTGVMGVIVSKTCRRHRHRRRAGSQVDRRTRLEQPGHEHRQRNPPGVPVAFDLRPQPRHRGRAAGGESVVVVRVAGLQPRVRPGHPGAASISRILPVFAAGNFRVTPTRAPPRTIPAPWPWARRPLRRTRSRPTSSRGPSACGAASTTFPEITAPGVGIRPADLLGGSSTESGTSLAAPHIRRGARAHAERPTPGLAAVEQEAALEQTAIDLGTPGPDDAFGHGRLDALAAYRSATASPTGPAASARGTTPATGEPRSSRRSSSIMPARGSPTSPSRRPRWPAPPRRP